MTNLRLMSHMDHTGNVISRLLERLDQGRESDLPLQPIRIIRTQLAGDWRGRWIPSEVLKVPSDETTDLQ